MHLSNPLENRLGYHLRRAASAMLAHLSEGLGDLGLRYTEASVLLMIEANPGLKQRDIGQVLGIKSANMAPLIGVLSKRNYIERKPLDGRSQGLYLSEQGKRVMVDIWQCVESNEAWLLPEVSDSERKMVMRYLQSVWES